VDAVKNTGFHVGDPFFVLRAIVTGAAAILPRATWRGGGRGGEYMGLESASLVFVAKRHLVQMHEIGVRFA
jgi:hypothetical protein